MQQPDHSGFLRTLFVRFFHVCSLETFVPPENASSVFLSHPLPPEFFLFSRSSPPPPHTNLCSYLMKDHLILSLVELFFPCRIWSCPRTQPGVCPLPQISRPISIGKGPCFEAPRVPPPLSLRTDNRESIPLDGCVFAFLTPAETPLNGYSLPPLFFLPEVCWLSFPCPVLTHLASPLPKSF